MIAGHLNIIHADFVFDMGLDEMSRRIGGWDAITLWFSGVHKARQHCEQIEQTGAASDADFRMQVEERALRLAADYLAENGILHIAVRAGSSSIADAEKLMRAHWAGAVARHGLNIDRVTAMPGSEPHTASAIAVGNQALGAQDVSRFNVALTIGRKK